MITKAEIWRLLDRAEIEVTDWQLELLVLILNSDKPLRLQTGRRG